MIAWYADGVKETNEMRRDFQAFIQLLYYKNRNSEN